MSMMFLAAMMMAQTPATTQPQAAVAAPQQPVAKKAKPKQICEYMEITGSRAPRRVCRDAAGDLDLGPGIKTGTYDKASNQQSTAVSGSSN